MMLNKALTHKLTSCIVSHDVLTARFKCHFLGKIAQLCALVKLTIFIVGIPNFGIVYFKRYIFILCGKKYHLIGTLSMGCTQKGQAYMYMQTCIHLALHF